MAHKNGEEEKIIDENQQIKENYEFWLVKLIR